jgi:hypothetical protein
MTAIYAALVATAGAGFQVYQWREKRKTRLVFISCGLSGEQTRAGDSQGVTYLTVEVRNDSAHDLGLVGGIASAGNHSFALEMRRTGAVEAEPPPITLPPHRGASLEGKIPPGLAPIDRLTVFTDDGRMWGAPDFMLGKHRDW